MVSTVASADMAHATHPNYPERHEPGHLIAINGGPVLKVHPNLRYATDGRTAAVGAGAFGGGVADGENGCDFHFTFLLKSPLLPPVFSRR